MGSEAQRARPLDIDRAHGSRLTGGESHSYELRLAADQYLRVLTSRVGINISITLFGPDGDVVAQTAAVDAVQEGTVGFALIAPKSGTYRLEVNSLDATAAVSYYEARVVELRTATPADRARIDGAREAEKALADGDRLLLSKKPEGVREAAQVYTKTLARWRALGDRLRASHTLVRAGSAELLAGNKAAASRQFRIALLEAAAAGGRPETFATLSNIGRACSSLGAGDAALGYYVEALQLSGSVRHRAWSKANLLNSIGKLYADRSDPRRALGYYDLALPLIRTTGDAAAEATILNNAGSAFFWAGETQKALQYFNSALLLRKAAKDVPGEAVTMNNIGGVYSSLGDRQTALDHLNSALPLAKAARDKQTEADVLNNICKLRSELGEQRQALACYEQLIVTRRELFDRRGEATAYNNLGAIYYSLGDRQKALGQFEEARRLARKALDTGAEGTALANAGLIYDDLGDSPKAFDSYSKALPLVRTAGDSQTEAVLLFNLGYARESREQYREALTFYKQSIEASERIRTAARLEEFRIKVAEQAAATYQRAFQVHWLLGERVEAFELSERARARTFLDQVSDGSIDVMKGASAQVIRQDQFLRGQLGTIEQQLREALAQPAPQQNQPRVRALQEQYGIAQRRYDEFITALKVSNPEYASLRSVNPITLRAIQRLLDTETTIVSYFVTPESAVAFVIGRNSFEAVELMAADDFIKPAVEEFRRFDDLGETSVLPLYHLHSWLFAPLRPHIKTKKVCIVPHGVLNYLPFAALTDGRHYVGEEYTIYYLPSGSALPFIRRKIKPEGRKMLVLAWGEVEGLPVLANANQEARAAAAVFKASPVVGHEATESKLRSAVAAYNIIHLVAHGELNPVSPIRSLIHLAPDDKSDGKLEVGEVYGLNLSRATLVVLSACETQLGAHSEGDDMVGLNRAFIFAGAPTVVASLWKVDDEATAEFMSHFYSQLQRGKADALRFAQEELRKKYPSPYYWAAFVLTGDPGKATSSK